MQSVAKPMQLSSPGSIRSAVLPPSIPEAEAHAMAAPDALCPENPGGPEDAAGGAGQCVPPEDGRQPPVGLVVAQGAVPASGAHAQAPDAVDGGQLEARDRRLEGAGEVGIAPQPRPRLRVGGTVAVAPRHAAVPVAPHEMRRERVTAAVRGEESRAVPLFFGPNPRPGGSVEDQVFLLAAQPAGEQDRRARAGPEDAGPAAHEPGAVGLIADVVGAVAGAVPDRAAAGAGPGRSRASGPARAAAAARPVPLRSRARTAQPESSTATAQPEVARGRPSRAGTVPVLAQKPRRPRPLAVPRAAPSRRPARTARRTSSPS